LDEIEKEIAIQRDQDWHKTAREVSSMLPHCRMASAGIAKQKI